MLKKWTLFLITTASEGLKYTEMFISPNDSKHRRRRRTISNSWRRQEQLRHRDWQVWCSFYWAWSPSQCWERTFGCIWREIQSRVLTRWWTLFGERPNECKLLKEFHEQAIREKITFSCTNDPSKLKLYDQGADLCLEKAIQILSLKETSRLELQGSNSATIDAIRSKGCGNCNLEHPPGKKVLSSSQTHAFVWNAGKLGTALLFAVVLRRNRLIK